MLKIVHKKYGTRSFPLQVRANRHLSLGRHKNGKLGIYYVRSDKSEVHIFRYPRGGGKVQESHRPPGPYCLGPKRCLFLSPGEQLYIQADGRHVIVPTHKARRSVRAYPARAQSGFLSLYSYPPGALFLNNRLYAMAPVARLPLGPGRYKVRLYNGFLRMNRRFALHIKAGQAQRQVVTLVPAKGGTLQLTSARPAEIFLNGLYRGWTPARVLPLPTGTHQVVLRHASGKRYEANFKLKVGEVRQLHLSK